MTVRVGLCGFTMSMHEYGLHFPVVEVQNTFYNPPRDATMQKWLASTGPAVEYTMKVWQLVTHPSRSPTYRRLKRTLDPAAEPGLFRDSPAVAEGWANSVRSARVLSATAMLFQCPASFTPTKENVQRMRAFFNRIERPQARLLWEPRGAAWVAERGLALALCDELDLVHVVDPFVTSPEPGRAVYWRLHGIGGARHSYNEDELRTLQRMLRDVEPQGPPYVLFNNLPRVGDAQHFLRVLLGKTGKSRREHRRLRRRLPAAYAHSAIQSGVSFVAMLAPAAALLSAVATIFARQGLRGSDPYLDERAAPRLSSMADRAAARFRDVLRHRPDRQAFWASALSP